MRQPAISIEIKWAAVRRMLRTADRIYPKVTARAMNKVVRKRRTAAIRRISADAKVRPQRLIRRRMKMTSARPGRLVAGLRLLTTPIRVAALSGVRDTRKTGVRATGGRHFPRGFLATGKGGHPMAFQRRGRSRLPLEGLRVDVSPVANEVLEEELEAAAGLLEEEYLKQLAHELEKQR